MQGPPVIDNSQDAECEADSEGHGHGVLGIGVHALEDLSGSNDGGDNGAEPWLRQHNVRSPACSFSGSCTRPGHVSSLELERGGTAGNSALVSLSQDLRTWETDYYLLASGKSWKGLLTLRFAWKLPD